MNYPFCSRSFRTTRCRSVLVLFELPRCRSVLVLFAPGVAGADAGSAGCKGSGQLPEAGAHGKAVRGSGRQEQQVVRRRGRAVRVGLLPEPKKLGQRVETLGDMWFQCIALELACLAIFFAWPDFP